MVLVKGRFGWSSCFFSGRRSASQGGKRLSATTRRRRDLASLHCDREPHYCLSCVSYQIAFCQHTAWTNPFTCLELSVASKYLLPAQKSLSRAIDSQSNLPFAIDLDFIHSADIYCTSSVYLAFWSVLKDAGGESDRQGSCL